MTNIILASASEYKSQQIRQLQLPFTCLSADINESPLQLESAKNTALRLARAKAQKISSIHPDSYVIGCDQTACIDTHILSKPLSKPEAINQLQRCSGQTAIFYSAVSLRHQNEAVDRAAVTETTVRFRTLSTDEIYCYVNKENALNCAGGFKVESLGISLFESVISQDPSALIGLPLIALCSLLRDAGVNPLENAHTE